jgi:aspartyl-tRNA(Asn)/glutamyl-tRNA(Gln) amidotransferase subunit B
VQVLVDTPRIDAIRKTLPEHPTIRRDRFINEYGLPKYDADMLTSEKGYAEYFESVVNELDTKNKEQIKQVSNWIMTDVLRVVGEQKIDIAEFPISPGRLTAMLGLIGNGTISGKIAKEVFQDMLENSDDPGAIVEKKGLVQLTDEGAIEKVVNEVLEKNRSQVEKYRAGGEKVFGFFVGEVMKATKGKANPGVVNSILKRKLQ